MRRNAAARTGAGGLLATIACACTSAGTAEDAGNAAVYSAWATQRSHVEVTVAGSVARLLGTSQGPGGNHEGFLLHLRGAAGRGLTVRIEVNVDLTGPIDLRAGQDVEVRGEYVYAADGGVIHYTHRDPRGRHDGGYIRTAAAFYQ